MLRTRKQTNLLAWILLGIIFLVLCFVYVKRPATDPLVRILDRSISRDAIKRQIHQLGSAPHRAGTPENRRVGNQIVNRLKSSGLSPLSNDYTVQLPEPARAQLSIVSPDRKVLDPHEKVLPEDPFSREAATQIPYLAYSPDIDLEAEVVYANFGEREDYEILKQKGVEVRGKILLVRAQGTCRGMKARLAEEQGVGALLIYPELRDQGFVKPAFPKGPHINPWTIQEGSLLKFFLYPGIPEAKQENGFQSTLPKIPGLPISQQTALEIFKQMKGVESPENWRGLLPVSYLIGSGPVRVKFQFRGKLAQRSLQNIFATIEGSDPNQPPVIVGCHYDAWYYGASDPLSGTTAVLETAAALKEVVRTGWKPKRTIQFSFWDGEEFGMFGSTRWVEENLASGGKYPAAYINIDSAYRSKEFVGNVMPGLRAALDLVLTKVNDPGTGKRISDMRGEFQLPGFSSDTSPFLALAGAPTAEIGFGRIYSMYHSIYDDLTWMDRFGDPDYSYHAALAKILSLYLIELSGNDLIPYRFTEISSYAKKTMFDLNSSGGEFQSLQSALADFDREANRVDSVARNRKRDPEDLAKINALFVAAMRSFNEPPNVPVLPFRQRSMLVGASEKNGCGSDPLPGLSSAVRRQDQSAIEKEMERLIEAFRSATAILSKAEQLLRK